MDPLRDGTTLDRPAGSKSRFTGRVNASSMGVGGLPARLGRWRAGPAGLLLLIERHFFERRGPGIRINQHQRWICNPWTHSTGPDVPENRREPDAFMEKLLDLLE